MDFFVKGIFQKILRENKSFAPKYLVTLNKEKLPLFDKSLMTLEFLHDTMLNIQRNAFLSNVWKHP